MEFCYFCIFAFWKTAKNIGYRTHKSLDVFSEKYSSRIGDRILLYTKDYILDGRIVCMPVYYAGLLWNKEIGRVADTPNTSYAWMAVNYSLILVAERDVSASRRGSWWGGGKRWGSAPVVFSPRHTNRFVCSRLIENVGAPRPSFSRLVIQTGLSALGLSKTLGLRDRRFLASPY